MRAWAWMLGGLIAWTVHFFGVYTIASAADVYATADDVRWRMAGLAFSGLCLAAVLALAVAAWRRMRREGDGAMTDRLAGAGAVISAIAIVWQALPNLTGY